MKRLSIKIIGVLMIAIFLLHGSVLLAANSEENKLKNEKNRIL